MIHAGAFFFNNQLFIILQTCSVLVYISHEEMLQLLLSTAKPNGDLATAVSAIGGTATGIGSLITEGIISKAWTGTGLILTISGAAIILDISRMNKEFYNVLQNYFGDMTNSEKAGVFEVINNYSLFCGGDVHTKYYSAKTGKLLGTVVQTY